MQRTRVAAYGLITDGEHILLCRISQELPRIAGLWTLPGGGSCMRSWVEPYQHIFSTEVEICEFPDSESNELA